MSTDVNAQFAAERAGQLQAARDRQGDIDRRVAAGTLVPLGGGRYRINDPASWDNGEVLTLSDGQLVPEHGLDTTTGEVALYSAVPTWHTLGTVIPGGTTDIDEVLDLGRIAYQVEKRAVRYSFGDRLHTMQDRYVTVRDDTGGALGTVGGRYEVIQNRALFTFLEDLVNEHGVIWESAGALRGGRRVFVSMRVPESVIVDPGGLDEEITLFIAAMNSHDGTSKAETVLSPWRPVCGNTERFALRDARARWGIRHTSGAMDRIIEARRALGLTVKYADRFAEEETALARTDLALGQFHALIGELWPLDEDANPRTRANADRRRELLDAAFRAETHRVGRTAYAAERSITDYLDHIAPKRPGHHLTEEIARATALMEGTDDEVKTRAHQRLMLTTHR
jgi:phage/plasmid-like protein (TIGR03299 family)